MKYLSWLDVMAFSWRTIEHRRSYIRFFAEWVEARGIRRPSDVKSSDFDGYWVHIHNVKKPGGTALTVASQYARMVGVKAFFKWLFRTKVIMVDPASDFVPPKIPRRLPGVILGPKQIEEVLRQPDLRTPVGLRDRAVMEVLWSCAVRRMEAAGLQLTDLDFERDVVFVRQGKGGKDRLVPIGTRAILWVRRYLRQSRPALVQGDDPGALFLTINGEPLTPDWLTQLMRAYVRRSGVARAGSCHLFRHSAATSMVDAGADIRHVQEYLGHSRLDSTQVYTRVSLRKLKEVHRRTHPASSGLKR